MPLAISEKSVKKKKKIRASVPREICQKGGRNKSKRKRNMSKRKRNKSKRKRNKSKRKRNKSKCATEEKS